MKQIHQPNPETVRAIFSSIAPSYDKTNLIMSVGLHHQWNQALVNQLSSNKHLDYLDLCAGSGAIAERYLNTYHPTAGSNGRIVLADFCEAMLQQAQHKLERYHKKTPVEYITCDVTALPFQTAEFDRISMAYGLRNIQVPQQALCESYRVLRAGGQIVILELTRPKNPILNWLHRAWLHLIVRKVGGWMSHSPESYTYLQQSIHHFVSPDSVMEKLKMAGFIQIKCLSLCGGIATLFLATKPHIPDN